MGKSFWISRSKSGLWVTTGAEGSAGCEAISAYVSPSFVFSDMGGPRVGGWGLVDFDLDDLAWSRTFACGVSSILMWRIAIEMVGSRMREDEIVKTLDHPYRRYPLLIR